VKALTAEYLEAARRRLRTAREIAARDPATSSAPRTTPALYAARAALHEHAIVARSHRGVWHKPTHGHTRPHRHTLAAAVQRLQTTREQADYDALDVSTQDAEQAIETSRRFLDQISDHLAG
jgi:uncharacterized protein (UPF0332 family)